MAARRPFWKWQHWKSIGFCLSPPSTCIWNLKLKFQSKLDLCSGNHVVYRQTDGRTDGQTDRRTDGQGESSIPPSNFVGRGYKYSEPNPGFIRDYFKVTLCTFMLIYIYVYMYVCMYGWMDGCVCQHLIPSLAFTCCVTCANFYLWDWG